MVHGDDKGLIFPPRVAQYQVVVVPTGMTAKTSEEQRQEITEECQRIVKNLADANIRATSDLRPNYTPGFKFSDWEMKVRNRAALFEERINISVAYRAFLYA